MFKLVLFFMFAMYQASDIELRNFDVNQIQASNLDKNGIVTINNGIVTVLNRSGIFTFPLELQALERHNPKQIKEEQEEIPRELSEVKQKRSIFTSNFGGLNSIIQDGIFQNTFSNNIINSAGTSQSMSITNGIITLTNSSGTFVGTSSDNLVKLDTSDVNPNQIVNLSNLGPNQSVSVTNGIITISNSSGVYVGTSLEKLTKFKFL